MPNNIAFETNEDDEQGLQDKRGEIMISNKIITSLKDLGAFADHVDYVESLGHADHVSHVGGVV